MSQQESHLSNLLKCNTCPAYIGKGRTLSCIHSFCPDCCKEHSIFSSSNSATWCPLCKGSVATPVEELNSEDGVKTINAFITDLSKMVQFSEYLKENQEILCNICEKSETASVFCPRCDQYLCESCSVCHSKITSTKDHTIVTVQEIIESPTKVVRYFRRCCAIDLHTNQILKHYCIECETPVCDICIISNHIGHRFQDVRQVAEETLEKIDEQILVYCEILATTEKGAQELKSACVDIEDQSQENLSENEEQTTDMCYQLHQMLNKCEQVLLNESRLVNDRNMDIVSDLKKRIATREKIERIATLLHAVKENGSYCHIVESGSEVLKIAESSQSLFETSKSGCLESNQKSHINRPNSTFWKSRAALEKKLIEEFKSLTCSFNNNSQLITRESANCRSNSDRIIVLLGLDTGKDIEQKICHISLKDPSIVRVINSTPAHIDFESASCAINNELYAVGIGRSRKEMWKWTPNTDSWRRCADLTSGRRRHSVVSIGDKLYVLGGFQKHNQRSETLSEILRYDINLDVWETSGKLAVAADSAACVAYKHSIFLFCGRKIFESSLDCVQLYNTETSTTSLTRHPIPCPERGMRAVVYGIYALIIGRFNCYVYDLENDAWEKRQKFKTDVWHFGLTLDENTLYITGGGYGTPLGGDVHEWTITEKVKYLSVFDFLFDNQEAEWCMHAKLPVPALIHSYNSTPIKLNK